MQALAVQSNVQDVWSPVALVAVVAAYLIGSIPFGLALARLVASKDVRAAGSGNIGATNVARVAGKKLGVVTLVLDALKGVAPLLGASALGVQGLALGAVGFAAVTGHCFSVYLGFKGGKGVATGLGVFATLTPLAAICGAVAYVLAFAFLRISSIGSMALLAATLIGAALLGPPYWPLLAEGAISAVILWRHHENIGRLIRGQESKLS